MPSKITNANGNRRIAPKSPEQTLVDQINASKARIAKERDKLRDLIEEANEVLDSCDRADEALGEAVDVLSEYV